MSESLDRGPSHHSDMTFLIPLPIGISIAMTTDLSLTLPYLILSSMLYVSRTHPL